MPQSGSPHVPGHENWFHCDGELDRGCFKPACDDGPRNKEFSHGFGSRYEFPLPEVENAPVPSQMEDNQKNYKSKNLQWMMEMFAGILGVEPEQVCFRYENNQPEGRCQPIDGVETELPTTKPNIYVCHPGGAPVYPPECGGKLNGRSMVKSEELRRYEEAAKKSELLKLYEENSPANIKYFNPLCPPATA